MQEDCYWGRGCILKHGVQSMASNFNFIMSLAACRTRRALISAIDFV